MEKTEIDESEILSHNFNNENLALAYLLINDFCFLNVIDTSVNRSVTEYTTVVYVNANDIFAWGCADAECIGNNDGEDDSEIISLYKYCKENKKWGYVKWLCLKRNFQPQRPIKQSMIKDNYWCDTLEALPKNNS
jgi:hypothetical protein